MSTFPLKMRLGLCNVLHVGKGQLILLFDKPALGQPTHKLTVKRIVEKGIKFGARGYNH